jgi:hypothetical protein
VIDRLSILQLKLAHGSGPTQVQIRTQINEYARVIEALNLNEEVGTFSRRLDRINAMLWRLENDIRARERENDFGGRYISVSRMIRRLNDRRAAIKSHIDHCCGSVFSVPKNYL